MEILRESVIFEKIDEAQWCYMQALTEVPLMTSVMAQKFILCKGLKAFKVRVIYNKCEMGDPKMKFYLLTNKKRMDGQIDISNMNADEYSQWKKSQNDEKKGGLEQKTSLWGKIKLSINNCTNDAERSYTQTETS